jgi:hypothetical protein
MFGYLTLFAWRCRLCNLRIFLQNLKLIDGKFHIIMFDHQMNVSKVNIQNAFALFKIGKKILHCDNAHIEQAPRIIIIVVCCVLHNYWQYIGSPPPTMVFKIIFFVRKWVKCLLFVKVNQPHNARR